LTYAAPLSQGPGGFAPDPFFNLQKKKKTDRFLSVFSISNCLDRSRGQRSNAKAIQKTLTKLSAASIETIEQLAAALHIQ
jgi:1,6-anhydro-N-acetylmuramate kinase